MAGKLIVVNKAYRLLASRHRHPQHFAVLMDGDVHSFVAVTRCFIPAFLHILQNAVFPVALDAGTDALLQLRVSLGHSHSQPLFRQGVVHIYYVAVCLGEICRCGHSADDIVQFAALERHHSVTGVLKLQQLSFRIRLTDKGGSPAARHGAHRGILQAFLHLRFCHDNFGDRLVIPLLQHQKPRFRGQIGV